MKTLSMEIDEYSMEKGWNATLPEDYYDQYEQVCYSYKIGNDEYKIYVYYESATEIYMTCCINNEELFEKDILSFDQFIESLPVIS